MEPAFSLSHPNPRLSSALSWLLVSHSPQGPSGGSREGPLSLEPPNRRAGPWESPSSQAGPAGGPSLLPPGPLQGHCDPPLTQGHVRSGGLSGLETEGGALYSGSQGCTHNGVVGHLTRAAGPKPRAEGPGVHCPLWIWEARVGQVRAGQLWK